MRFFFVWSDEPVRPCCLSPAHGFSPDVLFFFVVFARFRYFAGLHSSSAFRIVDDSAPPTAGKAAHVRLCIFLVVDMLHVLIKVVAIAAPCCTVFKISSILSLVWLFVCVLLLLVWTATKCAFVVRACACFFFPPALVNACV